MTASLTHIPTDCLTPTRALEKALCAFSISVRSSEEVSQSESKLVRQSVRQSVNMSVLPQSLICIYIYMYSIYHPKVKASEVQRN